MCRTAVVGVIHAMEASLVPTRAAFRQHWREARLLHIVDKTLSTDVQTSGLNPDMDIRFQKLTSLAMRTSLEHDEREKTVFVDSKALDLVSVADPPPSRSILFSCSAFGSCIEKVKATYPGNTVLKPNEAMLESAVKTGGKIGVLSVFEPTALSIGRELRDYAVNLQQKDVEFDIRFVPGALEHLNVDNAKYDRIIASAAAQMCTSQDIQTLLLAMFSMARSLPMVSTAVPPTTTVLTSPGSAVEKLKQQLTNTR